MGEGLIIARGTFKLAVITIALLLVLNHNRSYKE